MRKDRLIYIVLRRKYKTLDAKKLSDIKSVVTAVYQ